MDGQGFGRCRDSNQPGADPGRRQCRHARGPALRRPTADDQRMPEIVLVRERSAARQPVPPFGWRIDPQPLVVRRNDRRRNADIGADDPPRHAAGRLEQVAGLGAAEGDGKRCLGRAARHFPGAAVDPGRHVDGDHVAAAGGDPLEQGGECRLERPVEPGTEQRIDQKIARQVGGRRERVHRPQPATGCQGGVTVERGRIAEGRQGDRPARSHEAAGHDVAVTAIVAGTGHHQDSRGREFVDDGAGDREPRRLHELDTRNAGGDRRAVDGGHRTGREHRAAEHRRLAPRSAPTRVRRGSAIRKILRDRRLER